MSNIEQRPPSIADVRPAAPAAYESGMAGQRGPSTAGYDFAALIAAIVMVCGPLVVGAIHAAR